jgi:signal transduction histidine kinase
MNRVWMKRLSAPLLLALGAAGSASAATLNDIYRAADQINGQAKQSQARIDTLTEETRNLLNDYKTVLKQIEGLREGRHLRVDRAGHGD